MTALEALRESADAFPPLKSAVGGFLALLETAKVTYLSSMRVTIDSAISVLKGQKRKLKHFLVTLLRLSRY